MEPQVSCLPLQSQNSFKEDNKIQTQQQNLHNVQKLIKQLVEMQRNREMCPLGREKWGNKGHQQDGRTGKLRHSFPHRDKIYNNIWTNCLCEKSRNQWRDSWIGIFLLDFGFQVLSSASATNWLPSSPLNKMTNLKQCKQGKSSASLH